LNGVRLYLLVLLALAISPGTTVRLAHSRISWIAFLLLTLAMLHYGSRFARRAEEHRSWRKQQRRPAASSAAGDASPNTPEPVAAG
jgi:hypothetical protein